MLQSSIISSWPINSYGVRRRAVAYILCNTYNGASYYRAVEMVWQNRDDRVPVNGAQRNAPVYYRTRRRWK